MILFIFLLAVAMTIAAGVFATRWLVSRQRRVYGTDGLRKKTFMTPNEVDFYRRLRAAVEPRWVVFPQVSMGALMDTSLKPAAANFLLARSRFSSKICDFVVCDPKTLVPQLVVELDDVMHNFDKDRLRDTMAATAGYRTARFWSRNKPDIDELRSEMSRLLALNKPS
jgi:Protein of unknown function (DUF2726)